MQPSFVGSMNCVKYIIYHKIGHRKINSRNYDLCNNEIKFTLQKICRAFASLGVLLFATSLNLKF